MVVRIDDIRILRALASDSQAHLHQVETIRDTVQRSRVEPKSDTSRSICSDVRCGAIVKTDISARLVVLVGRSVQVVNLLRVEITVNVAVQVGGSWRWVENVAASRWGD